MTPEIIEKLFPNALPSIAEIEVKYPPRSLPEGARVMRVAPSPTGKMHVGTLYQALLAERVAHQSGGVFFLRLEDTDQKREVAGAADLIINSLARYGLRIDEGVGADGQDIGLYGPYIQSQRREIYQAYAKKLLMDGLAYPCFCTAEDVDMMRKIQEKQGLRPGYYGKYAHCRHLTDEQILENLAAGKPWVLRFKSPGKYDNRIVVKDLMKGNLSMPENDMDIVLIKGDGLPTYHLAHAVDDHLMGTTHVSRGDEWLSSVPLHIQLFTALGWKPPKFAHMAPLQKLDNGNRRKLSKRHDPEASITYFWEHGYPEMAMVEYLLNLINASFEDWRKANPEKSAFDFPMNFNKVSNTAGALFDFMKLNSISKDVVAAMTAEEVYQAVLAWAKTYNPSFADRLLAHDAYVKAILNIERGIGKKSRKDLLKWEDVENDISYFFDELYQPTLADQLALLAGLDEALIRQVAADYRAVYRYDDSKEVWFDKIKQVGAQNGFASDMKAYKADPSAYRGSVADVAKILRVLITGRVQSPDLFAIQQVMGEDRVMHRLMI